jgi:DNA polymerase III delta subunit
MDRIFGDQEIRLTSAAVNALISLSGYSIGSLRNAAQILRLYYKPEGGMLELDFNEIVAVVPSLNYEDVFAVVNEVLYQNMSLAIDYYQKLKDRKAEVQWLFLDRLLAIFRDLWVHARIGVDLTSEQQADLGVDQRSYAKIKVMIPPSDEDLSRIYKLVLDVYRHSKSSADEDFVIEVLLVHIIKILRHEEVGPFPLTIRHGKICPPEPSQRL